MFRFIQRHLHMVLLCGALCTAQTTIAGPAKPPSAREAEFRGFVIHGEIAGATQLDVLVLDTRGEPLDGALYDLKEGILEGVLPLPLGVEAAIQLKALGREGQVLAEAKAVVRFNDSRHGSNIVTLESGNRLPLGAVVISPLGLRLDAVETNETGLLRYELRAFEAEGREVELAPDEVSWNIQYPDRTEFKSCPAGGPGLGACVEFRVPMQEKLITEPQLNACINDIICLVNTQPPPGQPVNGYKAISAGVNFTCALTHDQRVLCWGINTGKQLARVSGETCGIPSYPGGLVPCGTSPQEIICPRGSSCRYTALDAGFSHTCAIDTAGAVWCWGANSSSQLGFQCTAEDRDPNCGATATPRRVSIPGAPDDRSPRFVQVSAGHWHSCAVSEKGNVYCWGSNAASQLGSPGLSEPRFAGSPNKYKQVSAGNRHTCAVTTAGTLDCWGDNQDSQIHSGLPSQGDFSTPKDVSALHPGLAGRVSLVAAGELRTCASADGSGVVCWGNSIAGDHPVSSAVASDLELGFIAGTDEDVCTVAGGRMWCGWTETSLVPVPTRAQNFIDITVGGENGGHYCAVMTGGAARCWGVYNTYGQLGDGTTAAHIFPGRVSGP